MVLDRVTTRLDGLPPVAVDGAMGAGVLAIGIVEVLLWNDATNPVSQRPEALAILAVGALGVTMRRTNLWMAFALVQVSALGGLIWTNGATSTALAEGIVLYTIAERSGALVSVLALLVSGLSAYLSYGYLDLPLPQDFPDFVQNNFPSMILVWVAGRAQARRHAVAADLQRSTDLLNDERSRLVRTAVASERTRIAQELRVLILKGIEQMKAQTRVARAQLAENPLGPASRSVASRPRGGGPSLRCAACSWSCAAQATTRNHRRSRSPLL